MRISKKILAIALSILMAVSMMPFTVFAADETVSTYEELVAAVEDYNANTTSKKITLANDIVLEDTLTIDSNATAALTINGGLSSKYTLSLADGVGSAIYVKHGRLTLSYVTVTGAPSNYKLIYLTGSTDPNTDTYSLLNLSTYANVNCTNGYAVMVSDNQKHAYGVTINVTTNKNVTVYGYYGALYVNGNIKDTEGNVPKINIKTDAKFNADTTNSAAVYLAGYANVTITNGIFTGASAFYAKAGNINISGGTFNGVGEKANYSPEGNGYSPTGDALVLENNSGYAPVNVNVTGGTFSSTNAEPIGAYSNSASVAAPSGFVSGGTFLKGGATARIPNSYLAAGNEYVEIDGTEVFVPANHSARIGKTTYANIQTALASAKSGETVVVMKDHTYSSQSKISKNVTVDLAGHNVTNTYTGNTVAMFVGTSSATQTYVGNLNFVNSSETPAKLTLNGSICINTNGSSVTVGENVTIETTDDYNTVWMNEGVSNASITVDGTVINDNPEGATIYVHGTAGTDSTVTVNGDVVGGEAGIYAAGKATYNINGNVTGDTGIYVAQGTVNVASTAHVTGTGAKADYVYDGSGCHSTGDGIAVDNKYATAPVVNVASGATLESYSAKAYKEYKNEATAQGEASVTVADDAILIENNYIAEVGGVGYSTIAEAVAAAQDGDTINLLTDAEGVGIKTDGTKALTFDFGGNTYTVTTPVGSTGTENQAAQLLAGKPITFKNGTLKTVATDSTFIIGIHAYTDLTLEDFTVEMYKASDGVVKVNGGTTTLKGDTNLLIDILLNNPDASATAYTGNKAVMVYYMNGTNDAVSLVTDTDFTGFVIGAIYVTPYKPSTATDAEKANMMKVSINSPQAKFNSPLSLHTALSNYKSDICDVTAAQVASDRVQSWASNTGYAFSEIESDSGWFVPMTDEEAASQGYVAKMGGVAYTTLEEAVANTNRLVPSQRVITLLQDCSGNGIKVQTDGSGRTFTKASPLVIDFNGYTYTVDGETVGSAGTETNAFQLLKDNYITLQNGTITSEKAKLLIQNYSNLTLDNMTLTNNYSAGDYTLSNNYGNVVINDTTINAPANGYAFDISTGWSSAYTAGVTVTMKGDSVINGDIEVGSYANYDGVATIKLESGQLNGELVTSEYDTSWHKVSDEIGDNITVTKNDTCTYAAPEGYEWVSNGDGTSTLAAVVEYVNGANFTLSGDIKTNVYLDKDYPATYTAEITYNHASNTSETPSVSTDTVSLGDLAKYSKAGDPFDGAYMFTVEQAPAQISEAITIVIKDGDTEVKTLNIVTSEICKAQADVTTGNLQNLYKAIVDYGKAAQTYFDYNASAPVADTYYNDLDGVSIPSTGGSSTLTNFAGVSMVVTSDLGVNIYTTELATGVSVSMEGSSSITAQAGENEGRYFIAIRGINAADLGKNFTVVTDQGTITMSAYTVARSVVAGSSNTDYQNLAKAMYLYGDAAAAYFPS